MTRGHRWIRRRFIPWLICARCGLVWLHNMVSDRAARARCSADDDD